MALEIAGIVADRLSRDRSDVNDLQLAVARADLFPRDHCEQLALLAMLVLFGAKAETAVATAKAIGGLVDVDGTPAVRFVAGLIRALYALDDANGFPPGLAYRSTVYAELGDGPAVRVRFSCDDGAEECAFTDDPHGYRPDRDASVSLSLGLPGRILFRLGRDLAEFAPPLERRVVPFEVNA